MKPRVLAGLAVTLLAAISASIFFSEDLKSMFLPRSEPTGTTSTTAARTAPANGDQSPAPARLTTPVETRDGVETATFASGCFWCTEAVFQKLKGVESVKSGYSGGTVENPTYHDVCSETTGHAEAVQVTFDPAVISFAELLEVFWKLHDPTTLNQQGHDVGTRYRSAIFYHTEKQMELAQHYMKKLDQSGAYASPIVTEITPFANFYTAEDYHQNYFQEHGREPYCRFVISPKMDKLNEVFADKLK
jgi:peptide-methionine (S)-S-oxide reductase